MATLIISHVTHIPQSIVGKRAAGQNGSGQFDLYFFGSAFNQPIPARCGLQAKVGQNGPNFKKMLKFIIYLVY